MRTCRLLSGACFGALLAPCAAAFQTTRVSLATSGAQGNLDSAFVSGISVDGRHVAFVSAASNLVPGDTNGVQDVFVRDRLTGVTQRANVDSAGQQSGWSAGGSALSADGTVVAFSSRAADLVSGDGNGRDDIFVRDLASGVTLRVSVDSNGAEGNDHSRAPALSADGLVVAFVSRATNLVPGDTNGVWDAFVHDRASGATTRVSVDSFGLQSDADSLLPQISGCGRWVTFTSGATNLVPGDTNLALDAFVHDRLDGRTERVSVSSTGAEGFYGGQKSFLSGDARFVAFESLSEELVPGDTNHVSDVFVRDRASGTTERVSVGIAAAEAANSSYGGSLSYDGRFVTFTSLADNLVPGDTNLAQDAFVHDRATRTTTRISVDTAGVQADAASSHGGLSLDGHVAIFSSYAPNLVAGDTNGVQDVFARELGAAPPAPPAPFCTAGTTSHGCRASITASSAPSASFAHPCLVSVVEVEGDQSGLIFYGIDNACFLPTPWGAGPSFLCVRSPLERTGVQTSGGTPGGCDGALALDWNAFQQAHAGALGQPWVSGARLYLQGWFRDPPSTKTTSLSNALELTCEP